jgi:ATP-dependent exoDNAse (exonuclease V) beta subunit
LIAVTKLVNLLDKPSLVYWANKIGLDGVSLKEYRTKSQNKGTNKHKEIELYLKDKIEFPESNKLNKILNQFEIIGSEYYLKNDFIHGFADLVCKENNEKIIIDFKSTDKIYLSQKLQLSTYKEILKADKIAIINFKTWELKYINIDTKKYYEIVKRLYQVNILLNELNERL